MPQDCTVWSGAKRKIEIEKFPIKIAGSAEGDVIFIMDAKHLSNAFREGLTLNLAEDYQTVAANNSFESVQKVLNGSGVIIKRVRPVITFGRINGYVLELDSDGYSKLMEYSVE